jgi:hypothetical protein
MLKAITMSDPELMPSQQLSTELDRRLDAEWTTLNAIREMLGIAVKGRMTPTYAQALDVGKTIAPQIYAVESSLLGRGREPKLVQEYRQKADALSEIRAQPVSPLEVLDEDIDIQRRLVMTSGDRDLIQRRLDQLETIRPYFLPKSFSENQLIFRDVFRIERNLPMPPTEGDRYRDFQISDERRLRIRMLHPDRPEHATGADMIYELYWDKKQMARIALVQYKIWDGKTLYLSQARNVEEQMRKLTETLCDRDLCKPFEDSARIHSYRLPYCSAFLRPTDKIQDPDVRLISSGLHTPVCVALRAMQDTGRGNKKIESKVIRSEAVTHKVFEEMFNANLLGSRWLTYEEIETLYRDHKVLEPTERIVLHVQEFGLD